jgi:hypothetical protein
MASPPPTPTPAITTRVAFSPDHKTFFVNGLFGTLDSSEGRLHFYQNHWRPEPIGQVGQLRATECTHEFVTDIRMTPYTFKSIMQFMRQRVDAYEQAYGEIRMQPTTTTAAPPATSTQVSTDRRYV